MQMKTLGASIALLLTTGADAQVWVREPARSGVAVRDERLLREIMLAGHNEARAAFGVVPLHWDDRLAEDARSYAAELARTERFQHSTGRRGNEPQGENLWTGTLRDYSYAEMIGHWLAERRYFQPGTLPRVSATGRFQDVSHYTQIVWPTTRRFGCAIVANALSDYLVCRYAAPGNVAGQRLDQRPR